MVAGVRESYNKRRGRKRAPAGAMACVRRRAALPGPPGLCLELSHWPLWGGFPRIDP